MRFYNITIPIHQSLTQTLQRLKFRSTSTAIAYSKFDYFAFRPTNGDNALNADRQHRPFVSNSSNTEC